MINIYLITVFLFFFAGLSLLVIIISWKEIMKSLKLKKLIKLGYVICRLKRIDKTETEIVTIPDKETNSVKFPGVEGIYTLDDASVILKDRKYPVYEWREGETAPINHEKEFLETKINCPKCHTDVLVNVAKPKSIAPSVLNNLILKIKTLSEVIAEKKLLTYLLIGGIIIAGIAGLNAFLTYDLEKRIGELLLPTLQQVCGGGSGVIKINNSIII